MNIDGQSRKITNDMVVVKREQKTVHVEEITPGVVEPAFGIGRILYSVLEHSFRSRENDQQRNVFSFWYYSIFFYVHNNCYYYKYFYFFQYFSFPASIAPLKCCVFPLSGNTEFQPFVQLICKLKYLHFLFVE